MRFLNSTNIKAALTSNNGESYTFDGVHLSKAGGRKLANELILLKFPKIHK